MTNPGAERSSLVATLGVAVSADLLELALTHRSFAYENGAIPTNERLEFLGDSILGQAVTVMLYRTYPHLDEGHLAKRRASLVSTVALAEIARGLGLGEYVRLGKGEILTGGHDKSSILADTVEALIGAVYLDRGGDVATAFVLRLMEPLLADPNHFGTLMDPKTSLQELAAARGVSAPVYTVTQSGPDHAKEFIARVDLGDVISAAGNGTSKKFAEVAAARDAFAQLSAL
ncbi:ribonuclease III [Cryobacterium sp. CG_9.6]|uniref:ribonuclease III n=1 Tax=Cryobacterium sp. CG_9.6 TaxID=2760710 RepID=UPI0024760EB2|nr:ribonuclease III [Cryobacterium sp. CG_9.6]MDH6237520.1 ribonuclease-3 [Cryobacterium sp. CG_9.6]